jgi:hypothetical protein
MKENACEVGWRKIRWEMGWREISGTLDGRECVGSGMEES